MLVSCGVCGGELTVALEPCKPASPQPFRPTPDSYHHPDVLKDALISQVDMFHSHSKAKALYLCFQRDKYQGPRWLHDAGFSIFTSKTVSEAQNKISKSETNTLNL